MPIVTAQSCEHFPPIYTKLSLCVALGTLLSIGGGAYLIAAMQHPSIRGVPDVWYKERYSLQNIVLLLSYHSH